MIINREYPFLNATSDFLTSCNCCGERCGEVGMKCPTDVEDCDFDKYIQNKSACLEKHNGE